MVRLSPKNRSKPESIIVLLKVFVNCISRFKVRHCHVPCVSVGVLTPERRVAQRALLCPALEGSTIPSVRKESKDFLANLLYDGPLELAAWVLARCRDQEHNDYQQFDSPPTP